MKNDIVLGTGYRFNYTGSMRAYIPHAQRVVTVLREIQPAVVMDGIEKLFHVQGQGGVVGVAYASELWPV